jgi:hypothetical protein
MVQPMLTSVQTAIKLPDYKGYISVAPGKRYFQDEQGQGFIVIGQNDAITWPGLVELLDESSPQTAEEYIRDLRANGVTVSRVMMEYAQFDHGYMENPVGAFSPSVTRFWDEFIALAEKYGLYLLLTPYDTFWQVNRWTEYPYSAALGGPCQSLHDWLTLPASIDAHKARWDFIIRRWGGSPNIFAWDIMNEIDLYWGSTPDEIRDYITEMANFIRQTEQEVWGKTHLVTCSAATPTPETALGQVIYNHPLLDFANTHLYVGPGIRNPLDAIECAEEMISGVRLSLHSIGSARPYLDTESGPMDEWIADPVLDREYHHNMSWAHMMSGGAGSAMRWPYTTPHWILPEMRQNLHAIARFATAVDWTHFSASNIATNIRTGKPGVIKTGCTDKKTCALVWLLVDSRLSNPTNLSQTRLSISNILPDGEYRVEMWETGTGTPFAEQPLSIVDGKLVFFLPEFIDHMRDIAIIIRKAD